MMLQVPVEQPDADPEVPVEQPGADPEDVSNSSTSGMSTTTIIIIAASGGGGLLLLVLVAALCAIRRRQHKLQNEQPKTQKQHDVEMFAQKQNANRSIYPQIYTTAAISPVYLQAQVPIQYAYNQPSTMAQPCAPVCQNQFNQPQPSTIAQPCAPVYQNQYNQPHQFNQTFTHLAHQPTAAVDSADVRVSYRQEGCPAPPLRPALPSHPAPST